MDLSKLKEPFPADRIEWRLAQCGKNAQGFWGMCLAYVQARAIMDRLDDVCGHMQWKAEYVFQPAGVICRLSIFDECADWVTKEDGAEMTDIEPFKGGISGALKRAAVLWGIGRYLYDLESGFIKVVDKGTKDARYGKTKEGESFYWLPPELPSRALPKSETKPKIAAGNPHQSLESAVVVTGPAPSGLAPSQNPGDYVAPYGRPDVKGKRLKELRIDQIENALAYWSTADNKSPKMLEYVRMLSAMLPKIPIVPATESIAPSTLFQNVPAFVTEDIPLGEQPLWNPDELKE